MDPSALIFVALAVAWAVYLIPKALEHHEEGARTRTVDRFSKTMRVLARREPINRSKARLVPAGASPSTGVKSGAAKPSDATSSDAKVLSERRLSSTSASLDAKTTAAQLKAHRLAAARAARRRLRVVSLILVANAVVAALAYVQVVDWVWCAAPVGVLAAWLVACRLMVKRERAQRPARRIPVEAPAPKDNTDELARVDEPLLGDLTVRDPNSWDPVKVPLPTYVSKSVAPRGVTTIDLESTGVWSSGRNESDSALAREAEAAERATSAAQDKRRATGA